VLEALVVSGCIVDLILGLIAVEVLIVSWMARGRQSGLGGVDVLVNALAGVGILLALRTALSGGSWSSVAAWLGCALVAHFADLVRRWRRPGR